MGILFPFEDRTDKSTPDACLVVVVRFCWGRISCQARICTGRPTGRTHRMKVGAVSTDECVGRSMVTTNMPS